MDNIKIEKKEEFSRFLSLNGFDVEDLEKVYYTIVNYGIGKFKYDKDLLQNPQKIFDRVYGI